MDFSWYVFVSIWISNISLCIFWQYIQSLKFTPACEMWSVGCVVMEMATGDPPWQEWATSAARLMYQVPSLVTLPGNTHLSGTITCYLALLTCQVPSRVTLPDSPYLCQGGYFLSRFVCWSVYKRYWWIFLKFCTYYCDFLDNVYR